MQPEARDRPARSKAVFLDRDGVVIRTFVRAGVPHPPQTLAELEILPGVASAMGDLAAAGFDLFLVTNQPDVARKTQSRELVEAMHAALHIALPIKAVYVCYHDTIDRCPCRKPAPGMLLDAARAHGVDLNASFMVGDRWTDVAAGEAAGCRTLLIARDYSRADRCAPTWTAADLSTAARIILAAAEADRPIGPKMTPPIKHRLATSE